jgi:hypothetical protein
MQCFPNGRVVAQAAKEATVPILGRRTRIAFYIIAAGGTRIIMAAIFKLIKNGNCL